MRGARVRAIVAHVPEGLKDPNGHDMRRKAIRAFKAARTSGQLPWQLSKIKTGR